MTIHESDSATPITQPQIFSDEFLDALGAWQRGWGQIPALRLPLAAAVEHEAAKLPIQFRQCTEPCYRKRFLYNVPNNGELAPLIWGGRLDEGSATSWTADREIAKNLWGLWRPEAVTGAIFMHVPAPDEVVLNLPALWASPEFVAAATAYRDKGGAQAGPIFNFIGAADQREIILRTPLLRSEIIALSGKGSVFDEVCEQAGIADQAAKDAAWRDLVAKGIFPEEPTYVLDSRAQHVVGRTLARLMQRLTRPAA